MTRSHRTKRNDGKPSPGRNGAALDGRSAKSKTVMIVEPLRPGFFPRRRASHRSGALFIDARRDRGWRRACFTSRAFTDGPPGRSDDVIAQQRFAAPNALDVFQQQVDDIVLVASGLAGGVRRD